MKTAVPFDVDRELSGAIAHYIGENGVSFSDLLKYLSERESLKIGVELLGLAPSKALRDKLGKLLDSKGYSVPRESKNTTGTGPHSTVNIQVSAKRESGTKENTFSLTREEYLDKRKTMSRADICRELKISAPTLIRHVSQWGFRYVKDEMKALGIVEPAQPGADAPESAPGTPPADPVVPPPASNTIPHTATAAVGTVPDADASARPTAAAAVRYVTIQIPVEPHELPEVINTAELDRGELLDAAFIIAQASISWAYRDLVDIIGEENVGNYIQQYVERRWTEFAKSKGA